MFPRRDPVVAWPEQAGCSSVGSSSSSAMWGGQPSAGGPGRWDTGGSVVEALKAAAPGAPQAPPPPQGPQGPQQGPPQQQGGMGGPCGVGPCGGPCGQQEGQQHALYQTQQYEEAGARCCAGCGTKILDRYLLHALDRYWHNGCLKCSCCQATLADIGMSCFAKAGMILCRNDYIRLFGTSGACSGCGQMIPANDYVMRAAQNVYHVKCFACVKCHSQLVPGDRYNLVNGSVLCEQDCLKMLKGSPATVRKGKVRAAIKV
ncbi:hypothetical protein HPB47_023699 [Ixodes persulcatus]|uniref:Uncharacterized protein n=1 Tax=Ixodes persulcatus TaxID=34615 RepID=A0AC60Q6B8_IXOPE|nr:hypothetical protein HPB47_023699 [Ixodes persulcatus]